MQQKEMSVKPGDIVACFVPKYKYEEPQLAKVIELKPPSKVRVQWMHGSYSDL